MKKSITIFDFFKRKVSNNLEANTSGATLPTTNVEENIDVPIEENSQTKVQNVDMSSLQLQRDLRWRRQIYTYHVNQQDEIRRHYIKLSPYQPRFKNFLKSKKG